MNKNFIIKDNALNPQIYYSLRKKVNFKEYEEKDVVIALKNTLYSVVIFDGDIPIGIGRIVGDDKIVFFIKDVVVDPKYQGHDVGHMILISLFKYISKKACTGAYIGLMATKCCPQFYKKYGFIERPNNELGPGMVKFFDPNEEII